MPLAIDEAPPTVAVRPSAATDLLWVLLWLQHEPGAKMPAPMAPLTPFPPALVRRVQSFWSDGCRVYSELVLIAHASGRLFDTDPEPFLDDLQARMPEIGELQLRSETAADRDVILDRLRRLRADSRLRRRYVDLMRESWALVRELWKRDALPALQAGAAALAERAARAADAAEIVPDLARCGDELRSFVEAAHRRGEVVFSPNYFGGWYLVLDLPGTVLVGAQFDARIRADTRRHEMEVLAGQLRVLADPTRLAILAHVAESPLNVTELVRVLGLAQPTVSAHMRLLREAGLVRAQRHGGRTDYGVDRARLDGILKAVTEAVPGG